MDCTVSGGFAFEAGRVLFGVTGTVIVLMIIICGVILIRWAGNRR